ncbi:MAG TPA: FG-GAP-like repeat-containing protein [Kofleriaceae bacterium]|nr:FG-GAP-like repeat-containing protein [Kofleriaceae bacterium]
MTSPSTSWSGTTLDSTTVKNGVVYDGGISKLRLQNGAGLFHNTTLGISDLTVFAAVADFDRDGWDDFVGAGEASGFVRIYENHTYENPEPDWTNANATRTPKFVVVRELQAADNNDRWRPIAAADFNGDGWPDVFRAEATPGSAPSVATIWLNKGLNDLQGYPQFKAGYSAMASGASPADFGTQNWGGTNVVAMDYNGDRKIDLLVGSGENGGTIKVFLNRCTLVSPILLPPAAPAPLPCANNPTFSYSTTLITGLGFGSYGSPDGKLAVFAYTDVDGDGRKDLVAGGPACCSNSNMRLRYWPGIDGGGISATSQSIGFQGGATVVLLDDFSGDGKPDLIVGTDDWKYNPDHGGEAYYWTNDGSSTPFKTSPTKLTSYNYPTMYDYDVGFSFDYDHDPQHTRDVMIADGNHTANFYVLANRFVPQYVGCGTVTSGIIDLGPLQNTEMVVTAARIKPTYTANGGTVTFYLSNDDPASWVQATPCPGSATDLCASFPRPVGRTVRWKADMCSSSNHTQTPTLTSVSATYDYTVAAEHFRGGAVINDGVVYLGGFQQPGDRGHLYAINAGLSHTYWDAGAALDAMADGSRHIYTSNAAGNTRLDFTTAAASTTALQAALAAASTQQATDVITWARGVRFGVGNGGHALSRLGSIETSTPAILTRPGAPVWFDYLNALDKIHFLEFQAAQQARTNLVLFGSKDGMIHAIRTAPSSMSVAPAGQEAWAFVPPRVAASMIADYTSSKASGTNVATAYPDGSPTLADYHKRDGTYATAAIVGGGNGNQGLVALDVTHTIDSNGNVLGPTPMWTAVPGDGEAGPGLAKPVVARVRINGAERFAVIAGTGIAPDNPSAPYSKGRIVAAYDLEDGHLMWKFRAQCAVTSDLVVFETDDLAEPNSPHFDGYIDRVVFADACGYLYKVDPARDLAGDWNVNSGLGTIEVQAASTTAKQYALFSTAFTFGALGTSSPIAGTIAAEDDASGRMVLFFGTGGLESYPAGSTNQFYAVHADDGSIRSKVTGACASGRCEKFYGGIVVTPTQVVFTRTVDPTVGSNTCDSGSTIVQAMDLDAADSGAFVSEFTKQVGSAIMGGMYGDAGALYFATLDGTVSRIGTPRASEAGGDTAHPENVPTESGTETESQDGPFTLEGWRQTY